MRDDDGVDALAPVGVRKADDGALGDGGMEGDGVLDLSRIDVLATGDDHVLEAVDDVEVALIVEVSAVAGVHPAVADGSPGLLRLGSSTPA
jgi:hypothetical protein